MSNKTDYDDIIMEDNFDHCNSGLFPRYNLYKPHKRNYLEMLNDSKQLSLNSRFDNYRIINRKMNTLQKYIEDNNINFNNNEKKENLIKYNNILSNFTKAKKNLIIKKKIEYDEEKERKFVENYYRIKNAELNRLRFGIE